MERHSVSEVGRVGWGEEQNANSVTGLSDETRVPDYVGSICGRVFGWSDETPIPDYVGTSPVPEEGQSLRTCGNFVLRQRAHEKGDVVRERAHANPFKVGPDLFCSTAAAID